jgi:hypothetical protein
MLWGELESVYRLPGLDSEHLYYTLSGQGFAIPLWSLPSY